MTDFRLEGRILARHATDGVYGIRFAHNTDATVTNFKKTKAL